MPDDGMTAVAESPESISSLVPDVPETTTGETEGVVEPQTPEKEVAQQPEQPADDGRKIPPALREAFKADPRARDRWFKGGLLLEKFPEGVKQAEALISDVESLTTQYGVESLADVAQAIETERSEWNALDEQFSSGSPEFVKNIAEVNPEAFSKIMPAALETLASQDADTYNHLMARVIVNTIEQPLSEVYNALLANEATKPAAEKLATWYKGIEALANKQPERKIDPERQKFEKERQDFEQQKAQEYNARAESRMREYNASLIEKLLGREFARVGKNLASEKKANPDAYDIMAKNCRDAIFEIVSKDQATLRQYSALLQAGDQDKAIRFAQAKIDKLAPTAVNKIFRVFNRNISPRRATPTETVRPQAQSGGNGAVPLGRIPKQNEIDWGMMRAKGLDGSSGQVYLKGQKQLYSF